MPRSIHTPYSIHTPHTLHTQNTRDTQFSRDTSYTRHLCKHSQKLSLLQKDVFVSFHRCVRHKRVVMVGSSHMRFKADYLFLNCYSLPSNVPRKHEGISVGNIDFIWLRFLAEYESAWAKYLQPLNITRGDIVFIQTGAWDFNRHRLDYVLGRGLELFKSGLKYIRDMLVKRGASLVLVTVPPYSELSHNPDRGSRNNFALAAFNALVTSTAVNMAIPVHDEFGLILPRCEEFVCYSHYLCRDPKVDNLMDGEVGLISCNVMLRSVCVP